MEFHDLNGKLVACISEVLPTTNIPPPKYQKFFREIIDAINAINERINANLATILQSSATKDLHLSETEMKTWISRMEEKERIAIMPDVSSTEYRAFLKNVEMCLDTWRSWGWNDLPSLTIDVDYKELLESISTKDDLIKPPLTINNLLYWLLFNWIKTAPSPSEANNFIEILVRSFYYRVIDTVPIGYPLIANITKVNTEIGGLTTIIPAEWDYPAKWSTHIKRYIIHKMNEKIENNGTAKDILGFIKFVDAWNEEFKGATIELTTLSKKACMLVLTKTAAMFGELATTADTEIDEKVRCLIRDSVNIMLKLDTNHYLLRVIGIIEHHWKPLLTKSCFGKEWAGAIVVLDSHWDLYKLLCERLEAVCKENYIVKLKLDELNYFQDFEKIYLDDGAGWKQLLETTTIVSLSGLFEVWYADPIKKRYIKRFLYFLLKHKYAHLLKAKKDKQLETVFEEIILSRNRLGEMEGHEQWIQPLDTFINTLSFYIYQTQEDKKGFAALTERLESFTRAIHLR